MRRFLFLLLLLGFMPLLVGCDDIAKADEKTKTEEKAKADSTSTDGSKKSKRMPAELAELPSDDPLVRNALLVREQVVELEEELLEQLDELRANLAEAKADPSKLRESVTSFIDTTKTMKQKTALANEAISAVAEKTNELSRSSRHLSESYRSLAGLFRKKARDYSEKKLRDQLLQFAKDYDAIAASIPQRVKALDAVQKKLPSLKKKVREVNSFLNDAVAFLNSHPGVGSDPRDRYTGEFESFAVTFSEWIRTLDELRQALRENAVSKVIQDGFKKDVLAQQKLEEVKREEFIRVERVKAEELAKAEQAKRDEQDRLAKLAVEQERLAKERDALAEERSRLAKIAETPVPNPTSGPAPTVTTSCQPVSYCATPCSQPVACSPCQPGRFRLLPLFRRCP
ncbi:MAG: hypothetical protein U0798_06830 [Gemmataceae bacterium]